MKVYYDSDGNVAVLEGKCIAIIGYGIQGRAQALNLKDSGCDVIIGNIKDSCYQTAVDDGMVVSDIATASKKGDIIMVLIPDQAQKKVYEQSILPFLTDGNMLIFAHGYSIQFKEIVPPKHVDICLLAPRMPGRPIRDYYLDGGGVPAFVHVQQDYSGTAQSILLGLAKALGFTKSGAMEVTFRQETELDLFIEQFFLPLIIRGIRLSFDVLEQEGYPAEAALMELYASGELGELLMMSAKDGIYRVWKNNASPTCQYGIFRNSEKVLPEEKTKTIIKEVLEEIRNNQFVDDLNQEAATKYKNLEKYNTENEAASITKAQDNLAKLLKYRKH
jgi:ketol-acid reductoisomerase